MCTVLKSEQGQILQPAYMRNQASSVIETENNTHFDVSRYVATATHNISVLHG